jgi:putative transposase
VGVPSQNNSFPKVRQIRQKGKAVSIVPVPSTAAPDLDTRIALIQALIPVALEKVREELRADVERLAGERYVREGRVPGHVRWTAQRGSIYLADRKIPIEVPRVRDRLRNQEVPLPTYERLQEPRALDTGLLHRVLGGLSTREYARCAEAAPEAFGLSASTVSRRFKRATARKLRELTERRLEGYDLVALLLDGKTLAEDEMVAAVGVTITGEKVLLGFVQTATENRKVCAGFLRELVERGLRFEVGVLVVTDGAKGLHAAVREVFGAAALLQRCQWHKRENVLAYLPDRHRATLRRKLQAAYEHPTYEAAKRALGKVRAELLLLRCVGGRESGRRPRGDVDAPPPRGLPRAGHQLEDDECVGIHPCPRGESRREGRPLEEQRAEAAMVGDRVS